MEKLVGSQIRKKFLDFFQEKQHLIFPGAPLVPINDPTLLFINSGMAPLKKYFLGIERPPCKRLANYQACIRTRDIDDVGDRHHMTMFEMLGSWSIGDYYKQMAIELAWELLVDRFGFPPEKLYFTVYAGDPKLNLAPDEESAKAWRSVGVPEERIVFLGADNFWGPAGDTGPCGPCTEVFFDTGSQFGPAYRPGGEFDSKGRYIEIWNAGVFMEFNKNADGTFIPLPLKSVDTGSGLERMEFVINGYQSVYEVASLRPIVKAVQQQFHGRNFTEREYRILVDHLRAATLILSEGVKPSNEGQGYIPRRLLRKCISIGLRADRPSTDFSEVVKMVIDLHRDAYPHLVKASSVILDSIAVEVRDFGPVIRRGMKLIEKKLDELRPKEQVPSDFIFEMVTTHGIPLELIQEQAAERSFPIDEQEFQVLLEEHKNVSRHETRSVMVEGDLSVPKEKLAKLFQSAPATEFIGYQHLEGESKAIFLAQGDHSIERCQAGDVAYLVAGATPFYAESGGQAGDLGKIEWSRGSAVVLNTSKFGKVFVHQIQVKEGVLKIGTSIKLVVDQERRLQIQANHSATHLLHAALRQVVGPQAVQKGSSVDDSRLRFDFQHSSAVSPEQIREIEIRVNAWIRQNTKASTKITDVQSAISSGAIAMFGEKYDQKVRVVNLGDQATELCGGTHVGATGDIGMFAIMSETSVAKGIRRIEAVTGKAAIEVYQNRSKLLRELSSLLGTNPSNILAEVAKLKAMKSEIPVVSGKLDFKMEKTYTSSKGRKVWVAVAQGPLEQVRNEIEDRLSRKDAEVVMLLNQEEDRANLCIGVHKTTAEKLSANLLLNKLLPFIEGKGGGKPTYAQGGGKKLQGIDQLLQNVPLVINALES